MRKLFALLLAVLMLGSLATMVFAKDSPVGKPEFEIEIELDLDNPTPGGKVTVKEGDEYILIPPNKPGYEFDTFIIEGDYELVSKDKDKWVIIPKGNLKVHVKYKNVTPKPSPSDNKPVSPNTGDNMLMIALVMAVGLCGVVLAVRKLVRNH